MKVERQAIPQPKPAFESYQLVLTVETAAEHEVLSSIARANVRLPELFTTGKMTEDAMWHLLPETNILRVCNGDKGEAHTAIFKVLEALQNGLHNTTGSKR
jgi:hypothetical protein